MQSANPDKPKPVAIIGGGPAGLMAAEVLANGGVQVHLFEAMPSVGRKFLVAGKGGLNLTHAEPFEQFLSHYGERRKQIEALLRDFGPDELRAWAAGLGIETFVGTSNRVFPVGMKTAPLLHAWKTRLRASGVIFHFRHRWLGWTADNSLRFETPAGEISIRAVTVILALGGGSWPITGSSGAWVPLLNGRGVAVAPLRPSNCGFEVAWTEHFRSRFAGIPLKSVVLTFTDMQGKVFRQTGEFVITETGVEGSLIYACSARLRDEIEAGGRAVIHLDLAPGWTHERLVERLSRPIGARSMASHLERSTGIQGVKAGLLWEFVPKADFADPEKLARAIKDLPIPLLAARPLEEAISSAGGVTFEALDEHLMIRTLPGIFCAGEMLDWEAPTGGYLLTACFASGRVAGLGALEWMKKKCQGQRSKVESRRSKGKRPARRRKTMIIVSACLADVHCRYDGASKPCEAVIRLVAEGKAIPVCPEQLGGLPTPRAPAEINGDKVIRKDGMDVTEAFQNGAREALKIARLAGAKIAILKARSPSCGSGKIYDGSFTGRLVDADGVFTELCKRDGIEVRTEEDI